MPDNVGVLEEMELTYAAGLVIRPYLDTVTECQIIPVRFGRTKDHIGIFDPKFRSIRLTKFCAEFLLCESNSVGLRRRGRCLVAARGD